MRHIALATALLPSLLALGAAAPALAWGDAPCGGECYEKVVTPPVVEAVPELYVRRQGFDVRP